VVEGNRVDCGRQAIVTFMAAVDRDRPAPVRASFSAGPELGLGPSESLAGRGVAGARAHHRTLHHRQFRRPRLAALVAAAAAAA
jgi:hypothetical protein